MYFAEVKEVIYVDDNPNLIYGVKVAPLGLYPKTEKNSASIVTVRPFNISVVRIPIVGEVVAIIQAPGSFASGLDSALEHYYVDVVSLQGNIHHNAIPTVQSKEVSGATSGNSNSYQEASAGNTNDSKSAEIDSDFTENENIGILQPYIGDVIFSGRYGQSIRFSTTPKSGKFSLTQNWSAGSEAAPITIIRNSEQKESPGKVNGFITENFTDDDNSIIMASGQELVFEQASQVLTSINTNEITSWRSEKWGKTPQTLINSGRIVLNSQQQEIIAFAKNGIGLSSETNIAIDANDVIALNSEKIELGDKADQSLILGNDWEEWMKDLVNAIGNLTAITPQGPTLPFRLAPQWPQVEQIMSKINELLSKLSYTKKSS